jgi:hypothetical protein
VSGGALETVKMRRLLRAHVPPQPRLVRAAVRHGEGSSREKLLKMVHARLSTRGWAFRQVRNLTQLVEQRFGGPGRQSLRRDCRLTAPQAPPAQPGGDLQSVEPISPKGVRRDSGAFGGIGTMKRKKSHQPELVAYLCHFRPEPEGGFTVTCPKLPPVINVWRNPGRSAGECAGGDRAVFGGNARGWPAHSNP